MERESFGTFANGHPSLPAAAAGLWPNTSSYFPSSCVPTSSTSLPDYSCNNLIHIFPHFSGWNLGLPHGLRRGGRGFQDFPPTGHLGAEWELVNHRALLACSFLAILAEPAQIIRSSAFCDFLGSCCGFFAVFFGCGGAREKERERGGCGCVLAVLGSCGYVDSSHACNSTPLQVRLLFSNPNLQST